MSTESDHTDSFGAREPSRQILEEQVGRVHERFTALDKSFRRLFNTFVVLAVALFSFLFYPYVSVQGQKKRILDERQTVSGQIAALAETGSGLEDALGVLRDQRAGALVERGRTVDFEFHTKLWDAAGQHERELRQLKERLVDRGFDGAESWTIGLEPGPALLADLQQRREFAPLVNQSNPCRWEIGEPWVRCEMDRELRRLHNGLATALRRSPGAQSLGVTAALENLHDRVSRREDQHTDGNAVAELRLDVSLYWKVYLSALDEVITAQEERHQAVTASHDQRTAQLEALNAAVLDAEAQLSELQRFNKIDTPVGTLPVGLDKLILLFPLLLGIGSSLLASMFCETVRLRDILRGLYTRKAGGGQSLTPPQMALIAPLWLDPADPVQGRLTRYLLLLAAPALILAAIATLLSNGMLGESFLQRPLAARIAYLTFHGVGLGLSMTGFMQIFRGFRRTEPAPDVTHSLTT